MTVDELLALPVGYRVDWTVEPGLTITGEVVDRDSGWPHIVWPDSQEFIAYPDDDYDELCDFAARLSFAADKPFILPAVEAARPGISAKLRS
jgi:hypothetical protein